jgi:hypothetical protein
MGGRVLATVAVVAVLFAGCGDEDFTRKARAPVRMELSGVIQKDAVTVSPARDLGAGPFEFTISNQTDERHTVTLEGERVKVEAGSVEPTDTLSFRQTLEPGRYEVRAGSEQAVPKEIKPAVLDIGAERADSNSDLAQP